MRIRRKFLQLTKWTYPHGTEVGLRNLLPNGYKEDGLGNYYLSIGDNPTTMFTCHLDTACAYKQKVSHTFDGNFIRTNGKTILGADDKAGMIVVLSMIENKIPGLYYFFIGEEVGCIGSGLLAEQWGNEKVEFTKDITKIVSFDRRSTNSVITHQLYGRCCSDAFAKELSERLNGSGFGLKMEPDDTGIMTDSAQFMMIVPECTNISVGYYNEHTFSESQDIEFLYRLSKAVCKIDWETLPVERDMDEEEEEEEDCYDNYYVNKLQNGDYPIHPYATQVPEYSIENWVYIKSGEGTKKMYISMTQLIKERSIIYNWIFSQKIFPDMTGISWNGTNLSVESIDKTEFVGTRVDVMKFVPDLKFISSSQLVDTIVNPVKNQFVSQPKYIF